MIQPVPKKNPTSVRHINWEKWWMYNSGYISGTKFLADERQEEFLRKHRYQVLGCGSWTFLYSVICYHEDSYRIVHTNVVETMINHP